MNCAKTEDDSKKSWSRDQERILDKPTNNRTRRRRVEKFKIKIDWDEMSLVTRDASSI